MRSVAEQGNWWLKIVPDPEVGPVGSVVLWDSEVRGEPVSEVGWMVLPKHQGRGYASAALRMLLEQVRADGRWGDIHACPGVTNAASNALCRKFGFELVGRLDVTYHGRPLRCNHWVLRAG
jgi:RimJ/RimL family protein N-acetyltransferase